MKKQHLATAIFLAFLGVSYLFNLPTLPQKKALSGKEKEEKEHHNFLTNEPEEMFMAARAYPFAQIDISTYEKAIAEAQRQAMLQATSRGIMGNWTTQGPGNLGGRINTIAVNPNNEQVIYIGFSRGGIFKTIDGGLNWKPIFDNQAYLTIGDIEIDPQNPNIIYAGTGDPNIGYYSAIGDGLWKSTDAGETWKYIGLKETRIISQVRVDPKNSNTLFVAAMGSPFQKDANRGVYKSTDGGVTWAKKMSISDSTGVCELLVNPQNTNILYASTWDRVRSNNTNIGSGKTSGFYRSVDGGNSWLRMTAGLPQGSFSRTGMAMAASNPNVLYAMTVDAKSYNLHRIYRTNNGGTSWDTIPTDVATGLQSNALGGFGWYFGKLRVNPKNANDLTMLGVDSWRTIDGGSAWDIDTPPWWLYEVHADKHDLVYTPSGKILLATDGGLYKSSDDGASWEDIEHIPANMFYRVAYNPHEPTYYYGGAQDNGTTGGNLNEQQWERLEGGDGFEARFDPKEPNTRFYEVQYGNIYYYDDILNGVNILRGADLVLERKHWDCPYFLSRYEDQTIYLGAQRVWKAQYTPTPDSLSIKWNPISPNLTDNNNAPGVTNTITTVEESSLEKGLLYAGTADANLWRLSPNNTTWVDIKNGLPNRYITKVLPSGFNKNTVFVTLSGYRELDNNAHIYKSDNQGILWKSIAGDLPNLAVNDIFPMPKHRDSVLFVATDAGVYYTKNSGKAWSRLGNNMPLIPVFELEYNPVRNELFAATFARSIMSFQLRDIGVDTKPIVATNDVVAAAKIQIFPTIFEQQFTIKHSEQNIRKVQIFNVKGQQVFFRKEDNNSNMVTIETGSDWASGIYVVVCEMSDNTRVVKKVIRR